VKNNNKKIKIYKCPYCKKESEIVGIMQKEEHYYSLNLCTGQWEDFHGDESVKSQKFFCISCNKKINAKILKNLI
jgi:hypothetical protein